MLKSLPDKAVEYFHTCFIQFWLSDRVTTSWKWRWLHTIPKYSVDNPSPADLRTLMLCEVLRKIVRTNVVHKILKVLYETKILDTAHHRYLAGRGTSTSSMLAINYREDAEEKQMTSELSSFDAEKSYDSTSKPLLDWLWQRIGVPKEVASWLAHMGVDGTTVI